MQNATSIISQAVQQTESGPTTLNDQSSERKLYRVNGKMLTAEELLWERMTDVYGGTFSRQFGENPSEGWVMALLGLDPSMIEKGLSRMAADRRFEVFPPKALEFRRLCMPTAEELGLPKDQDAYRQAFGLSTGKHPSVIYALRNLIDDVHSFRRVDEKMARRRWDKVWAQVVDYVAGGGELPEEESQIEEVAVKADPKAVARTRSKLKGLFA